MSKVDEIEDAVRELSPGDLRRFREWFLEFDARFWDRQLERDAAGWRLDSLVEEGGNEHHAGNTRPL